MTVAVRHPAPPTETTTALDRPLRPPLALEPARHGSWLSVWLLALGVAALYPWVLSLGSEAHRPWAASPWGHGLLALACLLPVVTRIATLRLGLAPTVDERFSWFDHPERRAAYRTMMAARLPTLLRVLGHAPWPLGLLGWILYKVGV